MEVQDGKEETATLEKGLNFWVKQEQKFQALFGIEALKDKEFLTMKLRHYDMLWYKYKSVPLEMEGQLLRNILKFQRKKLEKSLYQGWVNRIIRKIITVIESGSAEKLERKMENSKRLEQYNQNSPRPDAKISSKDQVLQSVAQNILERDRKKFVTGEQQQDNTGRRKDINGCNYNSTHRARRKAGKGLYL